MTRHTYAQIAVFAVISILALAYGFRYISSDLDTGGDYGLNATMADSAGVSAGTRVTYRGMDVGRVASVELSAGKVALGLEISAGTDIPAGSQAQVVSGSVLGDKYVDIRPQRSSGPYLADGDELPIPDELAPIPLEKLFADVNTALETVDPEQVRVLGDATSEALDGAGPVLAGLIEDGATIARAVDESAPTLAGLLTSTTPIARDLAARSSSISGSVDAVRDVSGQLGREEPSLVYLLDESPAALGRAQKLLDDNRETGASLLTNALVVTPVLAARDSQLRRAFDVGPAGFDALAGTVKGDRADFQLVATQGPVCVYPTPRRNINDFSPREANRTLHCPQGDGHGVRGADAAPRVDDLAAANRTQAGEVIGPPVVDDPVLIPLGEDVVNSWKQMLDNPAAAPGAPLPLPNGAAPAGP